MTPRWEVLQRVYTTPSLFPRLPVHLSSPVTTTAAGWAQRTALPGPRLLDEGTLPGGWDLGHLEVHTRGSLWQEPMWMCETCGGVVLTYLPPVLPQDLFELQLCDRRICISEDRVVPCVLCTLPARVHLPHLLRGAHRLRLPQPALHDGSSVSGALPRKPLTDAPPPSL